MTEDIERWNTFGGLEVYVYLKSKEYATYYDTYSPAQKKSETEMLRLMGMIIRLKRRNLPLAKHAYIVAAPLFRPPKHEFTDYDPKRGKKVSGVVPAKFIMEYLGCSRRTAIDHQLASKIDSQTEIVNQAMANFISEPESKTVTHNDTQTEVKQLPPPSSLATATEARPC